MTGLIMAAQLILGLTILVGIHEFGHLITAKIFGMRVEQYSIGFPPKIWGFIWRGTDYRIGAIPLGGYVKISGMIDESMDKEFLKQEPQPWEFRSKPAWQRLIVMMGGIILNVILGILIFIVMVYSKGEEYLPSKEVKYGIVPNSLAKEIGLQTGDKIVAVNGQSFEKFDDIVSSNVLLSSNGTYTIDRNGEKIEIKIPNNLVERLGNKKSMQTAFIEPIFRYSVGRVVTNMPASKAGMMEGDRILTINELPTEFYHQLKQVLQDNKNKEVDIKVLRKSDTVALQAKVSDEGTLGFELVREIKTSTIHYSFLESISKGSGMAFTVLYDNIKGFGKIFRGEVSASKSLSGPIGIAQVFGGTWQWERFWRITAVLSIVLAFMNFLPIPALDGGHVVFLSYEIISGRKPSDKFLEVSQQIGMFLLLGLMAFAIFNDLFKTFF